jgi:hypothetical protein
MVALGEILHGLCNSRVFNRPSLDGFSPITQGFPGNYRSASRRDPVFVLFNLL